MLSAPCCRHGIESNLKHGLKIYFWHDSLIGFVPPKILSPNACCHGKYRIVPLFIISDREFGAFELSQISIVVQEKSDIELQISEAAGKLFELNWTRLNSNSSSSINFLSRARVVEYSA